MLSFDLIAYQLLTYLVCTKKKKKNYIMRVLNTLLFTGVVVGTACLAAEAAKKKVRYHAIHARNQSHRAVQ